MIDRLASHDRDVTYIRAACGKERLTIYTVDTELGEVNFTLEAENEGQIWAGPMRVNGSDHLMVGRYRCFYEHEGLGAAWAPNYEKPVVALGGYPGLKRMHGEGYGIEPTSNARDKISRAFGSALEPFMRDHLGEAKANERELAARECERRAEASRTVAEREILKARSYDDEAAAIRAGGPFVPLVHR